MDDLISFFEEKIAKFQSGAFQEAAATLAIPCVVNVGTQQIALKSQQEVVHMLRVYHGNLMVEDYDRTTLEVLHLAEATEGYARILLTWRNLNAAGAVISEIDASYFCKRQEGGGWVVTKAEFVREPVARLADGLALHPAVTARTGPCPANPLRL